MNRAGPILKSIKLNRDHAIDRWKQCETSLWSKSTTTASD